MSAAPDPEFIIELFSDFGPVTVRRMFSGAGVFADGLMIALVVDSVIYLKGLPPAGAALQDDLWW